MTKAFLIVASAAITLVAASGAAAQDYAVYGDTGVRYDARDGYRWDGGSRSSYGGGHYPDRGYSSGEGYYSSGSVYGRGSYSSENRQYDSGWRRADGYASYPSQGYDADYYAHGRVYAPETDVRVYARTGANADGYSYDYRYGAPYAQGYAYSYSHAQPYSHGYGYDRHDRGGRYGYSDRRDHDRRGYRDRYGYNDDRPPRSRAVHDARDYYSHDRDCRCSDVYLYDR